MLVNPKVFLFFVVLFLNFQVKAYKRSFQIDKPIITVSTNTVCSLGDVVTFNVSNCAGTINWLTTSTSSNFWNSQVGQSRSAIITGDGGYFATCTNNGITSSNSDTVYVSTTKIQIKAEDTYICSGGTVSMEALLLPSTGVSSIQWRLNDNDISGATGNTYSANSNGDPSQNYRIRVTYNNGCIITSSVFVLQNSGVLANPNISAVKSSTSGPAFKVFDKRYGGDIDEKIVDILKVDGNNLILGSEVFSQPNGIDFTQKSRGLYDYVIVKTDSSGNKIWDRRFGGSREDYLTNVKTTSNGDILLFGTSVSGISGDKTSTVLSNSYGFVPDIWVVKTNSNGIKLWDKKLGGDDYESITDVICLPNNEFIIAGSTLSGISGNVSEPSRGFNDYWICKIDSSGNKIWDKRFGGLQDDILTKITKLPNGEFLLAGSSNSGISGDKSVGLLNYQDIWLVKIDNQGSKIWDKRVNYPSNNGTYNLSDLSIDSNGFIFMLNKNQSEDILTKTDSLGNIIWNRFYSTFGMRRIRMNNLGFQVIGNASFLPPTFSSMLRGQNDGIILQCDSLGARLWDKNFGGTSNDAFASFVEIGDDLVLGGSSSSGVSFDKSQPNRGSSDLWMVKVKFKESLGNPIGVNSGESLQLIVNNCPGKVDWNTTPITLGQVVSIIPNPGDTYSANCTAYGCVSTASTTVVSNCATNMAISVKNNSGTILTDPLICSGNTTFILRALNCGGTVTWSNGVVNDSTIVSPSIQTTYTATCSGSGCASVAKSVTIKLFDTPIIFNQGASSFCFGDSTTLKLDGGTYPGHTFEWFKDNLLIPSSQMASTLKAKENGTYKVKLIKNQCSSFSNEIVILAKPIPSAPAFSSSEFFTCSNLPVQVIANGCSSITSWSNFSTGSSQFLYSNHPQGFTNYTAKCILDGCSSLNTTIKVSNPDTYIEGESSRYICNNNSISLVNITSAPSTIKWYLGNNQILGQNSSTLTVNTGGYFKSEITLSNGCVFTSSPVEVIKLDTTVIPMFAAVDSITNEKGILKNWDRVYGGSGYSFAKRIIKLLDNNYLIVGTARGGISGNKLVNSKGLEDIYLIKIDSLGNKIWEKSYGSNWTDLGYSAVLTSDGNIIIAASSLTGTGGDKSLPPLGLFDIWLLKIDNSGNKIWDKSYGSSDYEDYPVIINASDDKILLGYRFQSNSGNQNSYYVINKLDEDGNVIWTKNYNPGGQNKITSIIQTADGGYLVAGESINTQTNLVRTGPFFGFQDIWLIKTDGLGNVVWDKSFGGSDYESNPQLVASNDGNFYIASYSSSGISGNKTVPNYGGSDFWLIKADMSGNKIWERNYGGSKFEVLNGIYTKPNGDLILLGSTNSPISNDIIEPSFDSDPNSFFSSDAFILEIKNANGDVSLQKRFGGSLGDGFADLILKNDNYLAIGSSDSPKSGNKVSNKYSFYSSDIWLVNSKITKPLQSSMNVEIALGQSIAVYATDCIGLISWSNGQLGSKIMVSPITNTTYTASCNFDGCVKNSSILVKVASCGFITNLTQSENIFSGSSSLPVIKRAYRKIEATNAIGSISQSGAAKYISGNSILLGPGFRVESGSIFQTKISLDPCND